MVKGALDGSFKNYHENPWSGHAGIFKTYKRLYEVVYWPGMWTDVKNFLKNCVVCQSIKAGNQKPAGKMQQTSVKGPNDVRHRPYGSTTKKFIKNGIPLSSSGLLYPLGFVFSSANCYSKDSGSIPKEAHHYKMGHTWLHLVWPWSPVCVLCVPWTLWAMDCDSQAYHSISSTD